MGCHTWIYKKAETLNEDQKQEILKNLQQSFKLSSKLNKTFKEYSKNMLPFYKEQIKEYDECLKSGKITFESDKDKKEMTTLMNRWRKLTNINNLKIEYNEYIKNLTYLLNKIELGLNGSIEEAYDWLIKNFFNNRYNISGSVSYRTYKGKLYIHIGGDNWFRVYGYPEYKFFNRSKLLNWLKNKYPEKDYGYYNCNYTFITGYTDELVNRISNLFNENGENNLLIEFG